MNISRDIKEIKLRIACFALPPDHLFQCQPSYRGTNPQLVAGCCEYLPKPTGSSRSLIAGTLAALCANTSLVIAVLLRQHTNKRAKVGVSTTRCRAISKSSKSVSLGTGSGRLGSIYAFNCFQNIHASNSCRVGGDLILCCDSVRVTFILGSYRWGSTSFWLPAKFSEFFAT